MINDVVISNLLSEKYKDYHFYNLSGRGLKRFQEITNFSDIILKN